MCVLSVDVFVFVQACECSTHGEKGGEINHVTKKRSFCTSAPTYLWSAEKSHKIQLQGKHTYRQTAS